MTKSINAKPLDFKAESHGIHSEQDLSLRDFLENTPMNPSIFFPLAISMASEIAKIHATGKVHGNITLTTFEVDPSALIVKIVDRTTIQTKGDLSKTILTKQNLPYQAPERIGNCSREPDSRSDLYTLGVVFYQILTGSLPFSARDELDWYHSHLARPPELTCELQIEYPKRLIQLIFKLLAKDLNDRYQSANSLLFDLKQCASFSIADDSNPNIKLGSQDFPGKLNLSGKVFGRERETALLLDAFHRVHQSGKIELILIGGYSGVGKTTLIHNLYKPVMKQNGIFISGKFDQVNRGLPYGTFIAAFQELLTQILGESEEKINLWKEKLHQSLGNLGQLLTRMIPTLEIIVGIQPDVPNLPPLETQNRFHNVLRKFVGMFANESHPLVIFLDDLHWADTASLQLLEHLVTSPEIHHILFVGAFRSNEVGIEHPLTLSINSICQKFKRCHEVSLGPLMPEQLALFLSDILATQPNHEIESLGRQLYQKTGGNPFFFSHYLKALIEENLVNYCLKSNQWQWDFEAIKDRNYTDNAADFMLSRLRTLPRSMQRLLMHAACIGNTGSIEDLDLIMGHKLNRELIVKSWLLKGILKIEGDQYRFLHDRVQQAAYSLLAINERKAIHLQIARLILTKEVLPNDYLFDLIHHYDLARELILDLHERLKLARYCLLANYKAKTLAASKSALEYSEFGLSLLPDHSWEAEYALTCELNIANAESLWRHGDPKGAELKFQEILKIESLAALDRLRIYRLLIEVNTTQGEMHKALHQCQLGLATIGIDFPVEPTDEQVQEVYLEFRRNLDGHLIESLIHLPPIADQYEKAALETMAAAIPAAIFTSANMGTYLYCKMTLSSMIHGNSDAAASAYTYFAMILGSVFGEYEKAYQFGKLGYDMARNGAQAWKARIYVIFGNVVNFWTQPMRSNLPFVRAAFPAAQEVGDLAGACYSCNHLISTLLALGEPLSKVNAETEKALELVRSVNYPAIEDILIGQQRLILALQGKTMAYSAFTADTFDEESYANRINRSQMSLIKFWYQTWKLQACYLFGKIDEALAAGEEAQKFQWSSPGHVEEVEYNFYYALSLAKAYSQSNNLQREQFLRKLCVIRDRFQRWSAHCPENFQHKLSLLNAEISRIINPSLETMKAYEDAICFAKQNHFIQDEAISYELAAQFCKTNGFQSFSDQYANEAKRCYMEWEASGKVHELSAIQSQVGSQSVPREISVEDALIDIDLMSLLRASQSISGKMISGQLSEDLTRLLVETSGAERGFLILSHNSKLCVEAESYVSQNELVVKLIDSLSTDQFSYLPQTVLNFTNRSHNKVLIADGRQPHPFMGDDVFKIRKPRSVLCLPILRNQSLVGMIYLENNFVTGAFTPEKLIALEILASQAAISIENARLYSNLSGEEQKLLATVESMVDGLIVSDVNMEIALANDAAARILGYESKEQLLLESHDRTFATLFEIYDENSQSVPLDLLPMKQALDGKIINQKAYRLRTLPNGKMIDLRISATPMRQDFGRILGSVLVIRDVTELMEHDRLKEEFLRAMAHELKTPLTVVSGYFQMFKILQKRGSNLSEVNECITRMEKGLNLLNSLVTTLVDTAAFQMGKLRIKREPFDLSSLCKELIGSLAITTSNHQLIFSGNETIRMVDGDRIRIGQVVTNLLQNAIKYSPNGGHIELQIHDDSDFYRVCIIDQGIGIPTNRQERLFQRFYRAHAETEHDYGGMGVGLFLVQEIIQAHHGQITFKSEEGVGSAFCFYLPKIMKS